MHITVFGAGGKVGSLVVAELLGQGYSVKAFVHNKNNLPSHDNLQIVQGDIHNAADVDGALTGSHAVISALGSWGTPDKDILSVAMRHIIPAMEGTSGIERIITVSGSDARDAGDQKGLIHRFTHTLMKVLARKVLHDGEQHIALLRQSSLVWTTLRSPVMTGKGSTAYRLVNSRPLPWATISREAVAHAMVDQIENKNQLRQSPYVIHGQSM